jgi:hypothetical protein
MSSSKDSKRMGLRRFSTSSQCRLETKGFHDLGLRLNHNDYLSLEPAIYYTKRFSFIDLIILPYPTTVSFYATAARPNIYIQRAMGMRLVEPKGG